MKRITGFGAVVFFVAAPLIATAEPDGSGKEPPGQRDGGNWGEITSEAISEGFDQGAHASQQSNPRDGLANVAERGNLSATIDVVSPNN